MAKNGLDLEKLGQKAWEAAFIPPLPLLPKAVARIGWTPTGGVARKWRRNGLKRLNPRPEMVWALKPRTHKMWYTGAVTATAEEPQE